MTATLSTRMEIPALGPGAVEIAVDYEYHPRSKELYIDGCFADINGTEVEVWDKLSQRARLEIDERCVEDYYEKMSWNRVRPAERWYE